MNRVGQLGVGFFSDPGMERADNQDSGRIVDLPCGLLLVVADGMGGHQGGATASKLAVQSVQETAVRLARTECSPQECRQLLRECILAANETVYSRAQQRSELEGMGTTLVLCLVVGDYAYVGHVGDSRAYYFDPRPGRVTQDHTRVQEMLVRGILTPEEAKNHQDAHRLSRAIGQSPSVEPDVAEEPLQLYQGDSMLLCSDGLYDVLTDDDIGEVVARHAPQEACEALIRLANSRGASDNVTVALVTQRGGQVRPRRQRSRTTVLQTAIRQRKGLLLWGAVACGAVLVGLVAILLGIWSAEDRQPEAANKAPTTQPGQNDGKTKGKETKGQNAGQGDKDAGYEQADGQSPPASGPKEKGNPTQETDANKTGNDGGLDGTGSPPKPSSQPAKAGGDGAQNDRAGTSGNASPWPARTPDGMPSPPANTRVEGVLDGISDVLSAGRKVVPAATPGELDYNRPACEESSFKGKDLEAFKAMTESLGKAESLSNGSEPAPHLVQPAVAAARDAAKASAIVWDACRERLETGVGLCKAERLEASRRRGSNCKQPCKEAKRAVCKPKKGGDRDCAQDFCRLTYDEVKQALGDCSKDKDCEAFRSFAPKPTGTQTTTQNPDSPSSPPNSSADTPTK